MAGAQGRPVAARGEGLQPGGPAAEDPEAAVMFHAHPLAAGGEAAASGAGQGVRGGGGGGGEADATPSGAGPRHSAC